jgi:ribosomal protein S27AE
VTLNLTRCNAYGAETGGAVNLGGFDPQPVVIQPVCPAPAAHRFRWVCAHGHAGRIVRLCETHFYEFDGRREAPWNLRRDVQFCPRCNTESDHRCAVRLVTVS